ARLDAERAARAADALLAAMSKANNEEALWRLALGLEAGAARRDPEGAAGACAQVAEVLLAAMRDGVKGRPVWGQRRAKRRRAGPAGLDPERAADALLVVLSTSKAETWPRLEGLSWALLDYLSARVDAEWAGVAADALLAAMSKTKDEDALSALALG